PSLPPHPAPPSPPSPSFPTQPLPPHPAPPSPPSPPHPAPPSPPSPSLPTLPSPPSPSLHDGHNNPLALTAAPPLPPPCQTLACTPKKKVPPQRSLHGLLGQVLSARTTYAQQQSPSAA
ncbi:unnamed protein product, partial [Lampetra planeri]